MNKKLQKLLELEGFSDDLEFGERYVYESTVPGICMNPNCDAIFEYEPDQNEGWCDECETHTVKSGLILMGII
jgi:hypothetical protein